MATRPRTKQGGMETPGLSSAGLLAAIQGAMRGSDIIPPGKGWKTAAQLAAEWNRSEVQTRLLLRSGIKAGLVETQPGKIGRHKTAFFRQKQGK